MHAMTHDVSPVSQRVLGISAVPLPDAVVAAPVAKLPTSMQGSSVSFFHTVRPNAFSRLHIASPVIPPSFLPHLTESLRSRISSNIAVAHPNHIGSRLGADAALDEADTREKSDGED